MSHRVANCIIRVVLFQVLETAITNQSLQCLHYELIEFLQQYTAKLQYSDVDGLTYSKSYDNLAYLVIIIASPLHMTLIINEKPGKSCS